MKYQTFAQLRIAAIALLIAAPLVWLGCRAQTPAAQNPEPAAPVTASNNAPVDNAPAPSADGNAAPAPGEVSGDTAAFTEVHRAILRMRKEPLSNGQTSGDTVKWVYKEGGIKAEFRCDKDKGFDSWNRVKIDYDGNKKDDERWDISKDGKIKRRVSPNDDGNFTETYSLNGETWVKR
ncbi:MAG: hypothetical protein SFU56_10220 [Capsulimonadales bacterium]|nr:hypothetical protein [Capsulimonadales bacterium]